MDGVSCVGAARQPAALLSRSFADSAAIARALSFSLSDGPEPAAAATDLGAAAAFVHGAGTGAHPLTTDIAAPSSSAARCRLGPAGGRAGKRRPRPSKRTPTTYISTDAATFRLMVQRVTGADDDAGQLQDAGGAAGHLGLGFLLPHYYGVAGTLLPPPDHAPGDAYAALAPAPAAAAPTGEQPLFPTLDSWNVMYGKNEVA